MAQRVISQREKGVLLAHPLDPMMVHMGKEKVA